jgi:diadenosine tetraphosphatase ApaH/serine/threonine PP2A family protein phosphatase
MRYAVISDIHSNLAAFQAVLDDAGQVDEFWCLGDVVGYGPDPNDCIALLRSLPHLCLAGNHDWGSIEQVDLGYFNADARAASLWTARQLTPEHRRYLNELPLTLERDRFTLAHGSPRNPIWEYVITASVAKSNLAHFSTRFCLVGHSHLPLVFQEPDKDKGNPNLCKLVDYAIGEPLSLGEARRILNPGSVGQPRDGDARASYAVLDTDNETIEYRRVEYPIEQTQKRMQLVGLPAKLIARLSFGM